MIDANDVDAMRTISPATSPVRNPPLLASIRRRMLRGPMLYCLLLSWVTGSVFAQQDPARTLLRNAIMAELRSPLLKRTECGIVIRELSSGKILFEQNTDLLMRPASNAKLVTSGAALLLLPDTFRFSTECFGRQITPGSSEIWVRGGGDPLFSEKDLLALASEIQVSGVNNITAIHLDRSLYDSTYFGTGWMWDDETDASIPYISSFPFARNRFDITVAAGERVGQKTSVTVSPACESTVVRNRALTGVTTGLSITRQPRTNDIRVYGTVKKGSTVKESISMWNPDELYACALIDALKSIGLLAPEIRVDLQEVPTAVAGIAESGHSLDEVLSVMNKQSDNLCAESLLKTIGTLRNARGASAEDGLGEEKKLFGKEGVDTTGISLVDGSGISFYNLITAGALSGILHVMYQSRVFERYRKSLAVPGTEGTLVARLGGVEEAQFVHAKTGTIRGVSTLSGYVLIPGAPPLSFVIFMQNFTGPHRPYRELQDRIVRHCLKYSASQVQPTRSR